MVVLLFEYNSVVLFSIFVPVMLFKVSSNNLEEKGAIV